MEEGQLPALASPLPPAPVAVRKTTFWTCMPDAAHANYGAFLSTGQTRQTRNDFRVVRGLPMYKPARQFRTRVRTCILAPGFSGGSTVGV